MREGPSHGKGRWEIPVAAARGVGTADAAGRRRRNQCHSLPARGGEFDRNAGQRHEPLRHARFLPLEIWTAYGISSIKLGSVAGNGLGQTIGIVDAYNDPNIISDVAAFSTEFGLPQFNVGGPTFQVLNQSGGAIANQTGSPTSPTNAPKSGSYWGLEISLDVEWAHAIAPEANIILFEATNDSNSNLFTAVSTAGTYCSVVSMSWGGTEPSKITENSYDADMQHAGVTYLSSTGDSGAPGNYPSFSPYVIAVGGTTLTLNADNTWNNEVVWSNGSYATAAARAPMNPSRRYQNQVNPLTAHAIDRPPTSAFDGDENTGVSVIDTYDYSGWVEVGGTSLSCPCWAGLIAIADQLRAVDQLGPLTTATALTAIYGEYSMSTTPTRTAVSTTSPAATTRSAPPARRPEPATTCAAASARPSPMC